MSVTNFEIGKTYTYTTKAPSMLGASFKRAKVLAVCSFDMVNKFADFSPTQMHKQLYPVISGITPGLIDNPKSYTYIYFQSESGVNYVHAMEWINLDSAVLSTAVSYSVTITNQNNDFHNKLRDALSLLGVSNSDFEITMN